MAKPLRYVRFCSEWISASPELGSWEVCSAYEGDVGGKEEERLYWPDETARQRLRLGLRAN